MCPVSTEGWTRRVQFVREGGGGAERAGRGGAQETRAAADLLLAVSKEPQRLLLHIAGTPGGAAARAKIFWTRFCFLWFCMMSGTVATPPAARRVRRRARLMGRRRGQGSGRSAGRGRSSRTRRICSAPSRLWRRTPHSACTEPDAPVSCEVVGIPSDKSLSLAQ